MVEERAQDVSGMTPEEQASAWERWVRAEIKGYLDIYLPVSANIDLNVQYAPHVVEETESGKTLDDSKADGVIITMAFKFEGPVDLTKPRNIDGEDTE